MQCVKFVPLSLGVLENLCTSVICCFLFSLPAFSTEFFNIPCITAGLTQGSEGGEASKESSSFSFLITGPS